MSTTNHHVQVIARLQVQPDKVEPMLDLMTRLSESSKAAPGNVRFDVLQCDGDPTAFVTHETWANAAAADAHMGSGYVGQALAALGTMLAAEPAIVRYTQIA
ncbi:MAG: antibiotic biosynthesis monooxygenase [Myxococcales bacterium]|nr:antibiotic biosynthesis monooxygenase [Myxococcales bacterium]MCB9701172.1 antibiotic biosynthesis monooxygenase [Myxococcales bacterium]